MTTEKTADATEEESDKALRFRVVQLAAAKLAERPLTAAELKQLATELLSELRSNAS